MKTLQTHQNGRCSNKIICKTLRLGVLFVLTCLFTLLFYSCAYAASGTIVYENYTTNSRLKVDDGKTLRMILKGDNYFNYGIQVSKGSTLIIEGDGSLTAIIPDEIEGYSGIGHWFVEGIGDEDCGTIIINSGTINVSGHKYAVAIGGTTGEKIEINGGVINSTHPIGCSRDGTIEINGGQINVDLNKGNMYSMDKNGIYCGDYGVMNIYGGLINIAGDIQVGVGGGENSELNIWDGEIRIDNADWANWININIVGVGGKKNSSMAINGGTVYVRPITFTIGGGGGASIGGADVDVTINGGNITAYANAYAAAIGCNNNTDAQPGTITINGGTVSLYSDKYAACIGGGKDTKGGNIIISGGEITAIASSSSPEAIGCGTNSTSHGTLTLEPNGVTLYVEAGTNENDAQPLSGSPYTSTASVISGVVGKRYFHVSTEGYRNEIKNLDGETIVHTIIVAEESTDSTNPRAIGGATIVVDGKTYYSDMNGQAFITESGQKTVTISKPGYRSQTLQYDLIIGKAQIFLLQKNREDGKPYLTRAEGSATISGLEVGERQSVDLRYQALHFAQNDGRTINVVFNANWNNHGAGTIHLYQGSSLENATKSQIVPDGSNYGFYPGSVFMPGDEVYVQLVAADGTKSDIVPLRLYIDSAWVFQGTEGDNSLEEGTGKVDWFFNKAISSDNDIFTRLFTWDFSLESELIPYQIELDHNEDGTRTFSAQLGILSADGRTNIKNMKTKSHPLKDTSWEEMKKLFKEVFNGTPGDYWSKVVDKFKKDFHPTKLRSCIETEVDVGGFFDVTMQPSGEVVNKEGGVYANIETKGKIGRTVFLGGFPVYYEASLGIASEIKSRIHFDGNNAFRCVLDKATLDFPKISAGAGVGVRGVCTAGIEGSAKHKITINNSENGQVSAAGTLPVDIGIRVKVLFIADEYLSFAGQEIPLWPQQDIDGNFSEGGGEGGGAGSGGGRSLLMASPFSTNSRRATTSNEAQFSIASRDYLNDLSSWYPYASARSFRAMPTTGLTVLQEGVMTDALPKLHIVDDKLVMLYLQDVPSRKVGNHTQLVYSVYENDVWSTPQPVWQTETADFFFDSYVNNGQLYVVWQKSAVVADAEEPMELLEQVASNSEIAVAVWNKNSNSFEQQHYITSNNVVDMMPVVGVNDGNVSVVWVSNDQNNVLGTAGTNSIHRMNLTTAGNSSVIGSTDQLVAELCASADGSHVLYSVQNADGTVDVIHINNGSTSSIMTSVAAAGLAYENGKFYWQVDGAIYCYDPISNSLEEIIPPETASVSSSYQYTSNGDKTVIVWLDEEEQETAIKASVLTGNQWSQEVVLLDGIAEHVTFFDAVMLDDGKYAVVLNTGAILEGSDERTTLQSAIVEPYQDVEMVSAISMMPNWETNQQEVVMTIRNNGFETVNNVTLTVADDVTTHINMTKDLNLAPGATTELTVVVDLSEFTTVVSPSVTISMPNDAVYSNNEKVITLGHVSVGLIVDYYEDNENIYFLLEAGNTAKTKSSTTLNIMEDSEDGTVLATVNTGVLSQDDTVQYLYAIDKSTIDFGEDGYKTYFFRIDSKESDWNTVNNLCFYTVTQNNFPRARLLTGTVSIDDYTLCGASNTAIVTETNNTGTLSYAWLKDGEVVSTEQVYTPTEADVGKIFVCQVTSSVEIGSISSTTYVIPVASFQADGVDSGVLSNILPGMKYSIDGGNTWNDIAENRLPLSGVTEENDIRVYQPAIGTITGDSEVQIIDMTQAATPTLVASQPTTINGTGSIPTDASHEYSVDGINWISCTGNMTDLVPGTYYVRVKASGTVLASETQTITIAAFDATQEATPAAVFNATDTDGGNLNNVSSGMKYSVDGGATWNEITEDGMTISGVIEENDIMLYMPGNGTTTTNSEIQTIDVTQADTPMLVASQPTTINGTGSIPTTASHEYSVDGINWNSCMGSMTDLVPGNYYVRVKASGTVLASETQTITIVAFDATQEATPAAVFNATGTDGGSLNNVSSGMKYSVDGGTTWNEITEEGMTISGVTEQNDIMLYMPGNGTTTTDSDIQTIDVTRAVTPTLVASQPTTINGTGSIPTDASHQYSVDGINWISCTGSTTDLVPGTYYIRVKANGTILASEAQQITISAVNVAQVPVIDRQPESSKYTINEKPSAMIVGASTNDGGTLSYQWYSSTSSGYEHGTAIPGANTPSYLPSTNELGTTYYYCVITNTNGENVSYAISQIAQIVVREATVPPQTGDEFPLLLCLLLNAMAITVFCAQQRKIRRGNK